MPKTVGMIVSKTSWRRLLANGLLALALVVSHALPMPSSLAAAPPEHHHQTMAGMDGAGHHSNQDHHNPLPVGAACQSCPGMAIFLPEAVRVPVRIAVVGYALPKSEEGQGISPLLDTPPPKTPSIV